MKLRLMRTGPVEVPLPEYATPGSAGFDLRAAITAPLVLLPGRRIVVPTGLMMAIPSGYEGQVRARSGHARKSGISVTNGVGTIDSDYRGHLEVLLINHGSENFAIKPLMKIAQFVVSPVVQVEPEFVDELDKTERGAKGFGSTDSGEIFQPFFKGEKPTPG